MNTNWQWEGQNMNSKITFFVVEIVAIPLLSTHYPDGHHLSSLSPSWWIRTSRCQRPLATTLEAIPHQCPATCLVTISTPTTVLVTFVCQLMSGWPLKRAWCGSCTSGSSANSSAMEAPLHQSTPALTSWTHLPSELLWKCHDPYLCHHHHVTYLHPATPPSPCPHTGPTRPLTGWQCVRWMTSPSWTLPVWVLPEEYVPGSQR